MTGRRTSVSRENDKYRIEVEGEGAISMTFDEARRVRDQLKRLLAEPSKRRSLERLCRDKWEQIKRNDYQKIKVLREADGTPVKRVRIDREGNETETDEDATIKLFHVQKDYGGDWLIMWNLDDDHRTRIEPCASDFVAALDPAEQPVARKFFEKFGVVFESN